MAKPYQDLQGNWFVAGRPMSANDLALHQAAQANMPQQVIPQATVPQMAPQVIPGQVIDPIQAAMIEQERMKRIGLNPLGAGINFLSGGK